MKNQSVLWEPSKEEISRSNLCCFINEVANSNPEVKDFNSLYDWSVNSREEFWPAVWNFCGIKSSKNWDNVLVNGDAMPGAKWFDGAELNFAENLLKFRDDDIAIIFRGEDGASRNLTYAELYKQVADCAALLKSFGIKKGDRVAGYMSNNPDIVAAMLAATSMGAIWSSCSPDFGVKGVLERFAQIKPRILFVIDGYYYNGKKHNVLDNVSAVVDGIPSIEKVVVVPFLNATPDTTGIRDTVIYGEYESSDGEIEFEQLPFDHPLYILYSSGTTGKPKCIVHSAGGTLIQHLKEHQLHCDVKRSDKLFYFTTCGWMMWNWLVSGLGSGCTIVLYDGSPFYPGKYAMWEMADQLGISIFGTSARYISTCAKSELTPGESLEFPRLRSILSTGSPLVAENFDYVYENIKSDVMLSSVSGGTDIASCFVLGCPLRPVHRGEIQCRGLGMAVDVFDKGKSVVGERGELVCTKPFPSMPIGFWNEPDNQRYHDAYFSRFDNVWAQGDYAEITTNNGLIIYGRSDAVLNPGGVRIGTAEIYRQVEKIDEVLESLCIAQQWEDDVRIVLFVMLRGDIQLTEGIESKIRQVIKDNTTLRHVPKKIVAVTDIPRTLSGKIVELAVRNIVHGDPVKNTDVLANPEALEYFRDIPSLRES